MNELRPRDDPWRPGPGERVRLRMSLDRPRSLDGQTGTVRYCWPSSNDRYPWLVALDRTVVEGGRAYTMVLCAASELEPDVATWRSVSSPTDSDGRSAAMRRFFGGSSGDRPGSAERRGQLIEFPAKVQSRPGADAGDESSEAVDPRPTPDVVSYREPVEFVGRGKQLDDFVANLALPLDDDRRRFVYSVFGPSGVGKTWLLRRFRAIVEERGGYAAWIDDAADDAVAAMEQIAGQFAAQGQPFRAFDAELRRYRDQWRAPTSTTAAPGGEASGREVETTSGPPGLPGLPLLALATNAMTKPGDRPSTSLEVRLAGAIDPRPVSEAVRVLTPLFLDGLWVAADRPVCLFFDVYDRTSGALDTWLRDLLNGRFGTLPGTTTIVIAGTEPLDGVRWASFDDLIARVPLRPFSRDETRTLLASLRINDERVARTIQQVSGQLPVLVATLAARDDDRLERFTDPDRTALDCFLASLGDPFRRSLAMAAALPRYLDSDVLARLTGEANGRTACDWLRRMPFVEQRSGSWTIRQPVRETLVRQVRAESARRWVLLHDRLADYYEQLRDELLREPPSRLRDATLLGYDLEAQYHRLCQNPPGYLPAALNGFVSRLGGDQSWARQWAEMIRQAGRDANDGAAQRWGDRLVETVQALLNGRFEVAARGLGTLLSTPDLEEEARVGALIWQSRLYLAASRFELALAAYTSLVRLAPSAPSWVERGITLLRLERYREALHSFERALALEPENAAALAHRQETERILEAIRHGSFLPGRAGPRLVTLSTGG